ncbi:MAG: NAD(P)H-dependent oxidoreductase [bacterium]|nr:NAD(P)H-dependent oxidoreductase [bacterium]
MIAIIVDETCEELGRELETKLKEKGKETAYISTAGLDIRTCYSCGYCSTKEYGKCCQKDDMEPILRVLVKSETMIAVTPVTFGSYSSAVKAVIDRTCVIGDTHYHAVRGEMVKGMRSDIRYQYVVGVKEECSEKEQKYFHNLVAENIRIMNIQGQSFILEPEKSVNELLEVICHE